MLTMFEKKMIIKTFTVTKNCQRNVVDVGDIDNVDYFKYDKIDNIANLLLSVYQPTIGLHMTISISSFIMFILYYQYISLQ